ncbi:putative exo-polygalacturonase [Usnea florida]
MFMSLLSLSLAASTALGYVVNNGTSCYVFPEALSYGGQPVDDTPSILQAFDLCGINGSVIFTNHTFTVDQVMNTTNLLNCDVSLYGEMVWSTNVPYWLSHSYGVVFQNLSTAWLFGGTNVTFRGYVWYDENMNNSNQPGRPIAITFYNSTNLLVDGLSWSQSQFWHSFISHSNNVTVTNVFMNSTSDDGNITVNTDGTDTWNSRDINLQNWTVQNGDDCIAVKGNTTNLYVQNITCYGSGGMPIGSIGQYPTKPDYVENVLFEDILLHGSSSAGWIKTWAGVPAPTSSNGDNGGGGTGFVRNVTWRNIQCESVSQPIYVTQCTYGNDPSICDTSTLQLSDITWQNITGTTSYNVAASIHCSLAAPCPGLTFTDVNLESVNASRGLPSFNASDPRLGERYLCANIVNENTTSGIPCDGWAPDNFPQRVTMNY